MDDIGVAVVGLERPVEGDRFCIGNRDGGEPELGRRERGCGRFEWSVLDWNTGAQDFYRGLGAEVLPDWRITRLTGKALERLAGNRS